MPTGYTDKLMSEGEDFRTFALTCARAFGACIMQREDPMDEPPKKQGRSDYHVNAIKGAQEHLAALRAMTPEQQRAQGVALRRKAVDSARASCIKSQAENARLDKMASQVQAWVPPTDEHKGLRDFMLEQIKISRNDPTWTDKWSREAEEKTPESYFVEAISSAVRDIAYHEKELTKEMERNESRNEWIDKLYESLPGGLR